MSRYTIKVNGDEVGQSDSLPILSGNVEERSKLRRVYYKYKGLSGKKRPYLVGPLYIRRGYLMQPDIDDTNAMNNLVLILLGDNGYTNINAAQKTARDIYNLLIKKGYMKFPFESFASDSESGNHTFIHKIAANNEYRFVFSNYFLGSSATVVYRPDTDSFSEYDSLTYNLSVVSKNSIPAPTIYPNRIVIPSSTENSKKKFAISVNDSGEITATEVTN